METTSVGGASSVELGHQQSTQGQRARSCSINAIAAPTTTTVVPEIELMLQPLPPDHRKCSIADSLDGTGQVVKSEDRTAASSPRGATSDVGSEESLSAPPIKYVKVPSNATGELQIIDLSTKTSFGEFYAVFFEKKTSILKSGASSAMLLLPELFLIHTAWKLTNLPLLIGKCLTTLNLWEMERGLEAELSIL